MENNNINKFVKAVIPLIIALVSIFVLSKIAASPEFHANTIQSLDEKKETVMELTAASTAASAAITLIPGDTATPIAEKLADLSTYFLLVICAIFLEKYLITITGYVTFVILIPLACIVCSLNVFIKNNMWLRLAKKLLLFGITAILVIPASVTISDLIEATYRSSIDETIESAKQITEDIQESTKNTDAQSDEGVISGFFSKITDGVSKVTSNAISTIKNVLNNLLEALAVMIVTSCVIPIVVLMFFVWLIKLVFDINISSFKKE